MCSCRSVAADEGGVGASTTRTEAPSTTTVFGAAQHLLRIPTFMSKVGASIFNTPFGVSLPAYPLLYVRADRFGFIKYPVFRLTLL